MNHFSLIHDIYVVFDVFYIIISVIIDVPMCGVHRSNICVNAQAGSSG